MAGSGPNHDSMRASDTDRERIVEQLRTHAADGRLTMDEFEERMSAAYEAKTYGALAELTRDLPVDLSGGRGGGGRPGPRFGGPPAGLSVDAADPDTGFGLGLGAGRGSFNRHDLHRQRNDLRRQMRHEMRGHGWQNRRSGPPASRGRQAAGLAALAGGWLSLSVLMTGVWLIGGLADGLHFGDFWPGWPIGILGLLTVVKGVRFFGDRG